MSLLQSLAAGLIPLGVAALLLVGLNQALRRAGRPNEVRRRIVTRAALGLAGWLALTGALAASGFFADFTARPPRLPLTLVPALVVAAVLARSKRFGALLKAVPVARPVGLQAFRLPLEGVLWWGFLTGVVPVQMTFEGLNFDVLTGLAALPVAYGLARQRVQNAVGIAFNVLGLVLLFAILTIAVLSAPGPLRVFTNEPANLIVATFPFVWTPTFLIPAAFFLHLVSLRQLLRKDHAAPSIRP